MFRVRLTILWTCVAVVFGAEAGGRVVHIDTFESPASASLWEVTGPGDTPRVVSLSLTSRERVQGIRSLRIKAAPGSDIEQVSLIRRGKVDLVGACEVSVAVRPVSHRAEARLLVVTEYGGRRRTFVSRPAALKPGWQQLRFRLYEAMFEMSMLAGETTAVWDGDHVRAVGLRLERFGNEVYLDDFAAVPSPVGAPVRPEVKGPEGKVRVGRVLEARSGGGAFELFVECPDGGLLRGEPFTLGTDAVVRFRLDEPGVYRWYAVSVGGPGRMSTAPVLVEAAPAREHVLPFSVTGGRLVVEDTLAGIDIPSAEDYSKHLRPLASGGGNLVRLWLRDERFFPPWREGRPDEAVFRRFDGIISEAHSQGLGVVLVLFSAEDLLNQFSPWLAKNGGPCSVPQDFFGLEDARDGFLRYVDYCLKRWGAYPNLLAMDVSAGFQAYPPLSAKAVRDWFREVSGVFDRHGPQRPLLAVSLKVPPGRTGDVLFACRDIKGFPEMLFVSGDGPVSLSDLADWIGAEDELGVPVLATGWKGGWRSTDDAADPAGRVFRAGIWAGAALSGRSAPLGWWWNSHLKSKKMYGMFSDIVRFSSPVAHLEGARRLNVRREDGGLLVGRVAPRGALLLAGSAGLLQPAAEAGPLGKAALKVTGLAPGTYETAVIDALSGDTLGGGRIVVKGEVSIEIKAPATPAVLLRILPSGEGAPPPAASFK